MLTFPQNLTVPQKQAFEKRYRQAAAEYIPRRVAYFQAFTGGSYSRITIRGQHTRWGSCSSRGTLSFNWRLMLAAAVERVMPDYKLHKGWLKEHGAELFVLDT